MISTMPKVVHDCLNLTSMVNYFSYHEHANGEVSKMQREVKDVQVMF